MEKALVEEIATMIAIQNGYHSIWSMPKEEREKYREKARTYIRECNE